MLINSISIMSMTTQQMSTNDNKNDSQATKNKLLDIEKPIIVDEKYLVNIPRRSSKPLNVKIYDS